MKLVTAKLIYEKIIGPINDLSTLDKKSDLNFEIPEDLNKQLKFQK